MKKALLFKFLIVLILSVSAQPSYPPPSGIFCSCPPTTTSGSGSVISSVASQSFVKGILVRIGWKDIEPTDNTYNWTLLDNQITAANLYNKKISLGIGGGPNTPSWLYSIGVPSFSYTLPFAGSTPIIWDATYLNKWTEFIRELGNRYQNDTTIVLVYMTAATTNGYEMQLPYSPTPTYTSVGYSDANVITAWKQIVDTFNLAFPNHYITNDFHPVNSSNTVADSVYNYAKTEIGARYGANAWWWTQNNTTVYPSQYTILQNSTTQNNFTGVQMAYSGTSDSASFGAGGLPTALQLATTQNICYWEIWNQDIINPSFATLLSSASCTTTSINDITDYKDNILIYPTPSTGIINVDFKNKNIASVKIFNSLGETVYYIDSLMGYEQLTIDISKYGAGTYLIKCIDFSNRNIIKKTLVISD